MATTTTRTAPPTTETAAVARPAGVVLRPDGLGVAAFGTAEQEAARALRRTLGPWAERGSWPDGQTAFGTCVGAVKALRWGRLYVLFTNGPSGYGPEGSWHLFSYQAASWKVFPVVPTGPARRLSGYSPRTAEGSAWARPSSGRLPLTVVALRVRRFTLRMPPPLSPALVPVQDGRVLPVGVAEQPMP